MTDTPEKKRPLPLWRRIAIGLILIAIAGLCVLMLVNYIIGAKLASEIAKISDAGQPINFSDLTLAVKQDSTKEENKNI